MTTPAYEAFQPNEPQGSNTGPNVPLNARRNERAVRDAILMGKFTGYTFERANGTGSAGEPQFWYFKNASTSVWIRITNTWTSGAITAQLVDWSDDAGATWAAVHTVDVITYDVDNNITSQTVASGIYVFILELIAKVADTIALLANHISGTGTAVHGLGTMSTQAKTAVDIDGGTIDGTAIGATVRAAAEFTRTTEELAAYAPGSGAGVVVDWSKGASKITNNGTNAVTFSNVPAGHAAGHILDVSNLNSTTFPAAVDWGLGGKPSIAGRTLVSLLTNDGGTKVFATVMWRAV